MLEVRALAQATKVIRQAQDIRKGVPKALIILSMVGKNYLLTKDMKNAARDLELPVADSAMTLRQIYADAPGQATLVWKMGPRGKEAALEIEKLFKELFQGKLKPKGPKASRTVKASGEGSDDQEGARFPKESKPQRPRRRNSSTVRGRSGRRRRNPKMNSRRKQMRRRR